MVAMMNDTAKVLRQITSPRFHSTRLDDRFLSRIRGRNHLLVSSNRAGDRAVVDACHRRHHPVSWFATLVDPRNRGHLAIPPTSELLSSSYEALRIRYIELLSVVRDIADQDPSRSDTMSIRRGVEYLERLVTQQLTESMSDLDALHLTLEIWCRERRKRSSDSSLEALQPRLLLTWIDHLAAETVLTPTPEMYRCLMDADLSNLEVVETAFQRLLFSSNDSSITPKVDDFHRVIHANLTNQKLEQAESYLQALIKLYRSNPVESFRPTPRTYNAVIAGYAKARRPRDASRVLQQLLEDHIVEPQASFFETCLNSWVSSQDKSAGHRAENLVLKMQELGLNPGRRCMEKVVAAWVNSKCSIAPKRALGILKLMLTLEDAHDKNNKAMVDAYVSVIRAYALTASKDRSAPDQCQTLVNELLQSDAQISPSILQKLCGLVILAWARSKRKDSAQHAQRLLNRMEEEHQVVPDRFCCNSLLEVHAGTGDGVGAILFWKNLCQRYIEGSARLKPDTKSVNLVLLAILRSKDSQAVSYAEGFYSTARSKMSINPDVVTFNALISVFGKSDNIDIARRGEEYLYQLEQLYKSGDMSCRPNIVTYTKAIELWVNICHPEAVERAVAHSTSLQRLHLKPLVTTYKAHLAVLERNGRDDEARKLQESLGLEQNRK